MSTRITPAAHELLRDLHGAVASLQHARIARTIATRDCEACGAWSTDPAWLAMEACEAAELRAEANVLTIAELLAVATPQCKPVFLEFTCQSQ
jgi:hypothetical protein